MNEGEFTTLKDGHVAEDLGELFIVTDRQLEVAGGVSEFLSVIYVQREIRGLPSQKECQVAIRSPTATNRHAQRY